MNKDSYMVKRHKHRCGRLGLITNTLLASAGAGTVAFLVTAINPCSDTRYKTPKGRRT